MKLLVAGACAAALAVGACTNSDGTSNRTGTGAIVGSTVGALGGLLVGGNDRRNALVGAGIGLLAGAGVGYYLDEQEKQLRAQLADTGAQVVRQGDRLLVSLPESITFDFDSSALKPGSRDAIATLASSLKEYPKSYIDVMGYTDSVGSDSYNLALSERRANAVAQSLIRYGVNGARIESIGMGKADPIASNDTEQGRARNRRVEVYIIPATE